MFERAEVRKPKNPGMICWISAGWSVGWLVGLNLTLVASAGEAAATSAACSSLPLPAGQEPCLATASLQHLVTLQRSLQGCTSQHGSTTTITRHSADWLLPSKQTVRWLLGNHHSFALAKLVVPYTYALNPPPMPNQLKTLNKFPDPLF